MRTPRCSTRHPKLHTPLHPHRRQQPQKNRNTHPKHANERDIKRRGALPRLHVARQVPEIHRARRRPRAPLPGGAGGAADGRRDGVDPARPAPQVSRPLALFWQEGGWRGERRSCLPRVGIAIAQAQRNSSSPPTTANHSKHTPKHTPPTIHTTPPTTKVRGAPRRAHHRRGAARGRVARRALPP